jgi:hypothetical protein
MQPSNKIWTLAAIGLLAIASACSGGGSRSTPSVANQIGQPQNAAHKNLALHFALPGQTQSQLSIARQLKIFQHNSLGIVATVTQPSPGPTATTLVDQQQTDVSGPPNCDAMYPSPRHCTVYINAKIGTDNIEVDAYDTSPNTPGQIATPGPVPSPYCVTKENWGGTGNCVPVKPAHALGVAITTGVHIAAGLNSVTLNMQPIIDQFSTNGQTAYTVLGYPLCDPESNLTLASVARSILSIGRSPSAPQQDTCSPDSRPDYVVSINGNAANFPSIVPILDAYQNPSTNPVGGYPGIAMLDGSTGPITGDGTCTTEDQEYNPVSLVYEEYGSYQSGFSTSGSLYWSPCGAGSFAQFIAGTPPTTGVSLSLDDRFESLYTGRGAVGTYNSNGTTTSSGPCPGPEPVTLIIDSKKRVPLTTAPCAAPYHNSLHFIPADIYTDDGLGPLPAICNGCSVSAPGNDPPGGFGVSLEWQHDNWRTEGFIVAPLYAVVVADSRCANPSNFGPFLCGGTLPANDDTGFNHTATAVLGGPNTLAVVDAAQFYPPTGYSFYKMTLSAGCPSDLTLYVPNNGADQQSAFPGYTDEAGNYTWGGQIFVLRAGNTLFTSGCTATITDSFSTTPAITITNPNQSTGNPGKISFP